MNRTEREIKIYPNPAINEVNVYISKIKNTEVTLSLTDILGNKIYFNRELSDNGFEKKISMPSIPAGIYLLRVEYEGEINTTRIIKQ